MKKGLMSLDTFIAILLKVLEIVLVVVVVGGILSIVWNKTNATPQDQDFKRILDAEEKIEKDFEDKEIASEQYFTVPIVSENPMQIAFYPEGGIVIPHKCKGKTCICMYYITTGGKKETCKTIDIKGECTSYACGSELCAGGYREFAVQRGDTVKLEVKCTDKGTQFTVAKA